MRRLFLAAVAACLPLAVLPSCHQQSLTAPSLQASCQAQPGTGGAPLAVSFLLSVAGAQGPFTVSIDYGDGSTGSDPGATHTYRASGVYQAAFTVATATQSALCSATVSVAASPAPVPLVDQPPDAVFKTDPDADHGVITGTAPLTVHLNMCETSDPDRDALWFTMDFDGNGIVDSAGTTGAHCRKGFTYAAGTYYPHICVHDVGADREPLHQSQCQTYKVVANP